MWGNFLGEIYEKVRLDQSILIQSQPNETTIIDGGVRGVALDTGTMGDRISALLSAQGISFTEILGCVAATLASYYQVLPSDGWDTQRKFWK